jgi:hypothetical protein
MREICFGFYLNFVLTIPMKRIIAIALALILVGCEGIPIPGFSTAAEDIVPVPLEDARLLFDVAAFAKRPPVRAKFSDSWQREEYALFQGSYSQAEIVYIVATARETALAYEVGLKSMIKKWNFNAGKEILWGEEGKGFSAFGTVFFQPFAHSGNGCFGFSAEWAIANDDPGTKPTKAVFGYYCEASKTALTTARIQSLIGAIEVSRFAGGSTASASPKSLITARGGTTGNPNYPFLLARGYFSEGSSFVDRGY